MENKQIKMVKNQPEPKPVKDIKMFLDFANFYRRFIQSFSRIAAPLISMLQITGHKTQNSQIKNRNTLVSVGGGGSSDSIENLTTVAKSAKSKMLNFAKAKFSRTNFLTFKA